MTRIYFLFVLIPLLQLAKDAEAQHNGYNNNRIPRVACPGIFRYAYNRSGGHYGEITVRPQRQQHVYELEVNMSVNAAVPENNGLKIRILSNQYDILNGRPIKYAIKFPFQKPIPKLTQVKFNGKVLCSDDPDPLEPGVTQSAMWAKSTIKAVVRRPTDSSTQYPEEYPSSNVDPYENQQAGYPDNEYDRDSSGYQEFSRPGSDWDDGNSGGYNGGYSDGYYGNNNQS